MKIKATIFFLLISTFVFSQSNGLQGFVNNPGDMVKSSFNSLGSSSAFFVNPKSVTEGSVYLFKDWNNYTIIKAVDNKQYILNNINLNIQSNSFQSKISQDSIFTFSFNNIDRFIINNRQFKNIYSSTGKKVYEIIFESEDFYLLKGFNLRFVGSSPNPMINRPTNKYIINESYYVFKDDQIVPFKMKKNKFEQLLGDERKFDKFTDFINKNNLSYRDENDIKKALNFINN